MAEPFSTIWNRSCWLNETQPALLKERLAADLGIAGFTLLGFTEHHFSPKGYTALWLLGESHLALHTFPEQGRAYLELTSCNQQMLLKFMDLVHAQFEVTPHIALSQPKAL